MKCPYAARQNILVHSTKCNLPNYYLKSLKISYLAVKPLLFYDL